MERGLKKELGEGWDMSWARDGERVGRGLEKELSKS